MKARNTRIMSQRKKILAYLQTGNALNPLQAWYLVGTTKLATRVSELIREDGHVEIEKRWVTVTTRDGDETRVREYYITPTNEEPLSPMPVL